MVSLIFFSDDEGQNSKRENQFTDKPWKDQSNDYRTTKKVSFLFLVLTPNKHLIFLDFIGK
jgi:hypothetical protein